MPFTLAHPAAILPFRGLRWLRTAPLVIGAMTPDVPYFLPWNLGRFMPETHDFEGSYTTCMVLGYGILLAILVLRRPLTALLSPRARHLCLTAIDPFRRDWKEWVLAAPALIIGVWSHLLWDSMTHIDGWIVHRVAALSAPVSFAGHTLPVCSVLQYLSSAFGLVVMAIWYARLPTPRVVPKDPAATRSPVAPILALIAAAGLVIGGVQSIEFYDHFHVIYRTLSILLTHSLAWFGALYLIAGVIVTLDRRVDSL